MALVKLKFDTNSSTFISFKSSNPMMDSLTKIALKNVDVLKSEGLLRDISEHNKMSLKMKKGMVWQVRNDLCVLSFDSGDLLSVASGKIKYALPIFIEERKNK
ncbi:hypothetical protein [Proteus mirabilis]|uniref:hypothetical protein n=1 Tax=Proteus mirabilis TaxID=584 RepID=UPI0034D5BAE0